MHIFTKSVSPDTIHTEVHLQRLASALGVAPPIVSVDFSNNQVHMEKIGVCIAEKYGDDIKDIPQWILNEIVEHLWTLYSCCQIQYVDITPYNFIEHEGRVWVIDFGDAYRNFPKTKLHPMLKKIFDTRKLTQWNPDFK
jgi:serine/threonine-protein kinase RIO1